MKSTALFEQTISGIQQGNFAPIYFLFGEEPYFIDRITAAIHDKALQPHEREFNETVVYGGDVNEDQIREAAMRYPMMAERQVVIVREAQHLRNLEKLESYFKEPVPTTILVFAFKYKKPDGRKNYTKILKKNSVYFESKKLREWDLAPWIKLRIRDIKLLANDRTVQILSDYLGNDLGKIDNELSKLKLNIPEGSEIDMNHVERYIGISRDFNMFEYQAALNEKDMYKSLRIALALGRDPKNHPIQMIIAVLFGHFSKVLKVHASKDKSQRGLVTALKVSPYAVDNYLAGARKFSARQALETISLLREYDLKSKGWGNTGTGSGELLKEMTVRMLG